MAILILLVPVSKFSLFLVASTFQLHITGCVLYFQTYLSYSHMCSAGANESICCLLLRPVGTDYVGLRLLRGV